MKTPNSGSKRGLKVRPLKERMAIVRKVNEYRKAHPRETLQQALDATKVGIKESAYYAWEVRRKLVEAEAGHNGEEVPAAVFPLAELAAALPERPKPKPNGSARGHPPKTIEAEVIAPRRADDKLQAVAQILEGFARLLR